jgi:hypothetical protein
MTFAFESNSTDPQLLVSTSGGLSCSDYTTADFCTPYSRSNFVPGAPVSIPPQTVLKYSRVNQDIDLNGNVLETIVFSRNGGFQQTVTTKNTYPLATATIPLPSIKGVSRTANLAFLGRLSESLITTESKAKFEYFSSGVFAGMLHRETSFAQVHYLGQDIIAGNEYQTVTEHGYDTRGNKNRTTTTAKKLIAALNGTLTASGDISRSTLQIYDATGRYVAETKKDIGGDGVPADELVERITDRAPNGAPLRIESGISQLVTSVVYDVRTRNRSQ